MAQSETAGGGRGSSVSLTHTIKTFCSNLSGTPPYLVAR